MGMASQDMARLRGEITGLRETRRELLENMVRDARERRNDVASMERHFHDAHAETTRTTREKRWAFLRGIKADVCSMQADLHKDLANIHDANVRSASQTRQECASFVSGLKTEVSAMRAGFLSGHSQMARKTKTERLAFIADQKNSVSAMRDDFRHNHNEMAISGKDLRLRFLSGLKANLCDMQAGFRKELADCRRSFQTVVKKAREERSTSVMGLREVVANMRQEFASQMSASRLAWLGITGTEGGSAAHIAQGKQAQYKDEDREPEPIAEEFIEFTAVREPGPDAVVLETGREELGLIEAAKQLPGREEKKTSKKEKRHQ